MDGNFFNKVFTQCIAPASFMRQKVKLPDAVS